MLEEGRGPRVPRSKGPKDQDISNSHSNMSLTLKKVHLVSTFIDRVHKLLDFVGPIQLVHIKECKIDVSISILQNDFEVIASDHRTRLVFSHEKVYTK